MSLVLKAKGNGSSSGATSSTSKAGQLRNPSVTAVFDVDSKAAAAQRKKALADLAKQGTLIAAPHIAFPGIGHLRKDGKGAAWVPVNYSAKP